MSRGAPRLRPRRNRRGRRAGYAARTIPGTSTSGSSILRSKGAPLVLRPRGCAASMAHGLVCVCLCVGAGRTVGQVDGEHRAEDEAEEEGGGRACKEGDLAERVRPARPPRSPSHRNRESSCPSQTGSPPTSPPFGSFHYSRHVTAQVKTLDHKPPMTEAEFTAYVPALFLRRTPRPERRAIQAIWCWASSTP